ncbi:hypothetical protein RI367_000189 [Sorochytrium milnesiophthora]
MTSYNNHVTGSSSSSSSSHAPGSAKRGRPRGSKNKGNDSGYSSNNKKRRRDDTDEKDDEEETENEEEHNEEENEEDTVTAEDVLAEQAQLELYAAEEFPYKTDNCSYDPFLSPELSLCGRYNAGYVVQQVYACNTCYREADNNRPFGFCYSCSVMCHAGHDVISLFSKRHFRCDCGTGRAPCRCKLRPPAQQFPFNPKEKGKASSSPPVSGAAAKAVSNDYLPGENEENTYNHNFFGRYCWCEGPDKEDKDQTMLLCIVCQDWYHENCIKKKGKLPSLEEFDDFICMMCTERYPFLQGLEAYMDNAPTTTTKSRAAAKPKNLFLKVDQFDRASACQQFRDSLEEHKLMYLIEDEPTWVPEADPEAGKSLYQSGMESLKKVPRAQAIDGARALQELEAELKQFLGDFARKKRVVTKADVNGFFERFHESRKQ